MENLERTVKQLKKAAAEAEEKAKEKEDQFGYPYFMGKKWAYADVIDYIDLFKSKSTKNAIYEESHFILNKFKELFKDVTNGYPIIERIKYEMSDFQKLMETNDIEAQREKRLGRREWQLFHEGKVDAYGLIISVLNEIIKDYDGKDL